MVRIVVFSTVVNEFISNNFALYWFSKVEYVSNGVYVVKSIPTIPHANTAKLYVDKL